MSTPALGPLQQLSVNIRKWILNCTHRAGSGHPTSSLSAVELMVALMFDGNFRYDLADPKHFNNDRLIFSKGHASPLFYAIWCAAGVLDEDDLMTYRDFDGILEGHPTSRFPYTEAATGSLGQGLSVGVGMAMNAKFLDELPYRTFVLLGDSEMTEGSQWEAIEIASHYQLNNLVGVLDVNRLGQRGPTMLGYDLKMYQKRLESFGWNTIVIPDGHNIQSISDAYKEAFAYEEAPTMIIAKTVKGKGVPFLENENGWHGKALDDAQLAEALSHLPSVPDDLRGEVLKPQAASFPALDNGQTSEFEYQVGDQEATRTAYGNAVKRLGDKYSRLVVLDGEVSNSTRAEYFRDKYPERYFEMFIAEQNMVGTALGMSLREKMPFVSTFAAFFTRAFDQIRMARYSDPNIKFVGSHAGVEIGQDGPSQMGLEDLAMFRSIMGCVVLYPCDAVSTERLVEEMAALNGMAYMRTTRGKLPVLYNMDDFFCIGGSHVLRQSDHDSATLIGAGVTLHECLKAHDMLKEKGIVSRVIDLYSIAPLDRVTLRKAAVDTHQLFVIEDHFAAGGIGEAVAGALADQPTPIQSLCVSIRPRSGETEQLLDLEGISAKRIEEAVLRTELAASSR